MWSGALDRALGIETTARDGSAAAGISDMQGYQASYWFSVVIGMRGLHLRPGDTFVDFGCGKGRALYFAAWYGFDRIVGVELDRVLADVARRNMRTARGPRRLRRVEVMTEDAQSVELPDGLRVAFLFNPFRGQVFQNVASRLAATACTERRQIRVIYANPVEEPCLLELGFHRVHESRHCSIYEHSGADPLGAPGPMVGPACRMSKRSGGFIASRCFVRGNRLPKPVRATWLRPIPTSVPTVGGETGV